MATKSRPFWRFVDSPEGTMVELRGYRGGMARTYGRKTVPEKGNKAALAAAIESLGTTHLPGWSRVGQNMTE